MTDCSASDIDTALRWRIRSGAAGSGHGRDRLRRRLLLDDLTRTMNPFRLCGRLVRQLRTARLTFLIGPTHSGDRGRSR
jgi:hypothetical protein